MGKMSSLDLDIYELKSQNFTVQKIASMLEIPVAWVYEWEDKSEILDLKIDKKFDK